MSTPSLRGLSPRPKPSVTNSTDLRVLSVLAKVPAPAHDANPEPAGTVPATRALCNE
ncbi:MAG UNVERIFIED_CONTAM: hypothetical protein LVR18_28590 [Planctomycetaceae bacterium]